MPSSLYRRGKPVELHSQKWLREWRTAYEAADEARRTASAVGADE